MRHSVRATSDRKSHQRATLNVPGIIYACTAFTLMLAAFLFSNEKGMAQAPPFNADLTPQQRRDEFERARTIDVLKQQTNDAGQRLLAPSDPTVVNNRLNVEVQDLHAHHLRMLDDMSHARNYIPDADTGMMNITPRYSAFELQQKRQDFDRQEQEYLNTRQAQELTKLRYAQGQAADLQAEADNLAKQLSDTRGNQGFRLSPVGTNLYVHNFESVGSDPEDEKPVARAAAPVQPQYSSVQSQYSPARPQYSPARPQQGAGAATQMPSASSPWAQLPAAAAPSNKAIIPPGWNPLEEPGRKQALQAATTRSNLRSKSTSPTHSNVKAKSVH